MRKLIFSLLACIPALAFATGRSGSGVYTLPQTWNPVVSGQPITATWANNTLNDIATELTNSLDRNGRGAMNSPLQCINGAVGAPALTFASELSSGLYLVPSNDVRMSIAGAWRQRWYGATPATGGIQFNGTAGLVDPVLGNTTVTISAVNATQTYTLSLPNVTPASTLPVTMSASGVLAAGQVTDAMITPLSITNASIANNTITRTQLAAVGQAVSSSSGSFSSSAGGYTAITNLTATIVTKGRPVMVMVQPDGVSGGTNGLYSGASGCTWRITRDAAGIEYYASATGYGMWSLVYLDTGASAASHTWAVSVSSPSGTPCLSLYMVLVVYEL